MKETANAGVAKITSHMLPGLNVELADEGVLRPGCLVNVSVRQRTFGPRRSVPLRTLVFEVDFVQPYSELFAQVPSFPFNATSITARADQLRISKSSAALLTCFDCVPELERISKLATTDDTPYPRGICVEVLSLRLGGWAPGRVIDHEAQNGEYVVRLDAEPEIDMPISDKNVRPLDPVVPTIAECMGSEAIQILDVTLPVEVIEWLKSEDNSSSFNKFLFGELWARTGVIWSSVCEEDHPFLRIFGCDKSLNLAEGLIQAQLKKTIELIAFSERRNRRLKLLEERRPVQESAAKTEFFVHDSLVGLVIGKQGENLSRIARTHNVEIRVFPDEVGARRLRIYGNDVARVNRAREELDFQYLEIPLPPEHAQTFMGWLSKERQMIRDMSHRYNLHSIWLNDAKGSITVCGLNRNIEDFLRALAQAHNDTRYSPVASTASREVSSPPSPHLPGSTRSDNAYASVDQRKHRQHPAENVRARMQLHEPIWPYPNAAGNHSTAVVGSRRPLSDRCPPAPYHPSSQRGGYRGDSYAMKPAYGSYTHHHDSPHVAAGPYPGTDGMHEYNLHTGYNSANCHPHLIHPHIASYHNMAGPTKNLNSPAQWGRQRGRSGEGVPPPPPRNVLARD